MKVTHVMVMGPDAAGDGTERGFITLEEFAKLFTFSVMHSGLGPHRTAENRILVRATPTGSVEGSGK